MKIFSLHTNAVYTILFIWLKSFIFQSMIIVNCKSRENMTCTQLVIIYV